MNAIASLSRGLINPIHEIIKRMLNHNENILSISWMTFGIRPSKYVVALTNYNSILFLNYFYSGVILIIIIIDAISFNEYLSSDF